MRKKGNESQFGRILDKFEQNLREFTFRVWNWVDLENDIVVELDDLSPVLKQGEGESKNNVIKTISSGLADDFDDVLSFTESTAN
ncbi:hypothetical protein Tco_0579249 [Tanacetum coccineum]